MARYVTFVQLAQEGHAESPFEMLRIAVDRGLALALDQKGRLCLPASVADKLRQERRERQARETFEREHTAALRQRQREEAEVAAVVQQERLQQVKDRERRLVERTGASLAAIEGELRRQRWMRPGTGGSLAELDRISSADISLTDLEVFVEQTYGLIWPHERRP